MTKKRLVQDRPIESQCGSCVKHKKATVNEIHAKLPSIREPRAPIFEMLLSDTGAALEFLSEPLLPTTFHLLFETSSVDPVIPCMWREQKRMINPLCESVWTKSNHIGIRFLD